MLVVVVVVVADEEHGVRVLELLLLLAPASESAPNRDRLRFRCAVRGGGYVVDESMTEGINVKQKYKIDSVTMCLYYTIELLNHMSLITQQGFSTIDATIKFLRSCHIR